MHITASASVCNDFLQTFSFNLKVKFAGGAADVLSTSTIQNTSRARRVLSYMAIFMWTIKRKTLNESNYIQLLVD